MSYKIPLENELEGDVGGYGCAVCGAITETEIEEYHAPNCHILEARRNAFLEAAEIVEDWGHDQRPGTHQKMAKLFRAMAEEVKN